MYRHIIVIEVGHRPSSSGYGYPLQSQPADVDKSTALKALALNWTLEFISRLCILHAKGEKERKSESTIYLNLYRIGLY